MALVTSRTALSQGTKNIVTGVVFATGTGADIEINDGATVGSLPTWIAGDFFEVRGHSNANNNGLYQVVTVSDPNDIYQCNKVSGALPSVATAEQVTFLGDTTRDKDIFFDTAALGVYVLETSANAIDANGVTGQAIYSFMMQEWKDDDFLMANAPLPIFTIDSDAGKYIIGQDASGNYSGWNWVDNATFSIRTRKLLRNMGWNEVSDTGVLLARYVGVVTLGGFEDETPITGDLAYYQFGNDTTVDDTVNFTFTGPVNEAVKFYEHIGTLSGDTPSFATSTTITRATGSFVTDGFKVGGQITILNSTSNNGTYVLSAVSATSMTISTTWTAEAWGTTEIAVDNDNALTLRLRVRDADINGKTFSQANLASAGKTVLGNFVFSFPLANSTDQKITVTDAGIDANSDGTADVAPYSGMSITYYATGQSRSGLVGGAKNFGIIVDANGGTAQQVYEFVQWSLRSTGGNGTGDIDADAGVAIGRTMDGLMRFVGSTLEVGSTDGGLTFPINPDGGGTGVFVDNLNAASKNSIKFWDNTQPATPLTFPLSIAITLDFNATLEGDVAAEGDLYYDRTIRTTVADLVLTASTSKITSATTALPTNSEIAVGKYVRLAGMATTSMDGVFQITAINTPGADWSVIRYDGAALADSATSSVTVDQNCVDTPDNIIVETGNSVTDTVGSEWTFATAGDTITGSGSPDLSIFTNGMKIQVTGTVSNDGIYTVSGNSTTTVITVVENLTDETAPINTVIAEAVTVTATTDFAFSYDFDNNAQGGRTAGDTFFKAKAIGQLTAQYTESTVQSVTSQDTAKTIPLVSQQERNVV